MNKILLSLGVIALSLSGAPTALAVFDEPLIERVIVAEETRLERVIVTASRVEELASRRAASIIVIDREQLELQNARDISEVLRFNAGFDIGRNGGPGQTTSVFIRGAESNHVLMLVDGVRVNPGTIGVPAIQNIDPDLIERIEIVKGPRSSVYGSDAIGGVVNVITRRGSTPKNLNVTVGGGSFGTQDASAQIGVGNTNRGANVSVSWYDTDGFATRTGAADDHGYDNLSFNLSAWQAVNNHRIEFDAWRSDGNTEYADFLLSLVDQDYTNQTVKGRVVSEFKPNWQSVFTAAHFTDDIQQNQPSFAGSEDFLTTKRLSFDWQNILTLAQDNRLILGLHGYDESVDVLSFGAPFDEDTGVFAAYAEYGLRGDNYDASIGARYTDHDDFDSATTWHTDLTYSITPQFQLVFAAGTGFRAPDATDRFGFGGNPELDTEESTTIEVGSRYRFSDRHSLSVRVFDQQIDNLINFVVTDFTTFAGLNQNVDETENQGIELSHQWVGDRLSIETNITIQDPKDKATDLNLLRRAEETLTTNAYYTLGNGTIGLNVLATGKRPDIDGSTFLRTENPGYVLGNLSYSHTISPQITVRASIDNVLDTDYQTANGFETAERSYYLEFNYNSPLNR